MARCTVRWQAVRVVAQGLILALGTVAAGCKTEDSGPTPDRSAQQAATPLGSGGPQGSAAASAGPERPWYVGKWRGTYESRSYLIQMPKQEGPLAAWGKDDGAKASGQGKAELTIAEDGTVSGTAEGPLGTSRLSGSVEGETVRIRLEPQPALIPAGFEGLMVLERKKDELVGSLQASSGDGETVRDGSVKLAPAR